MPRRIQLKQLNTRDLVGVEILSAGVWNGRTYTEAELDAAVSAFNEIGPPGTGQVRPPGKLGHDDGQALAQEDGFPAMGWVNRLYRRGTKLLADFTKVPAAFADLITAGVYDAISSECYIGLKLNDTVYPFVIGAVSFLGADLPAVKDIKSISDIAQLFTADAGEQVAVTLLHESAKRKKLADISFEDIRDELNEELAELFPTTDTWDRPWVIETYTDTFIFADSTGRFWRGAYSQDPASGEISITQPFTEVNRITSWVEMRAELTARLAHVNALINLKESPNMERKKLAQLLGLAETATEAEIEARLTEINKKPNPSPDDTEKLKDNEELRKLREEVGTLRHANAMRDAQDLVTQAMREGKILPAMKEWAENYALKDTEGFKAYVKNTPRASFLNPVGHEEDLAPEATAAQNEATEIVRRQMGSFAPTDAQLKDAASNKSTAEVARERTAAAAK